MLLGEQLAMLHHDSAQTFDWERDNYIGLTAQSNARATDWANFFRDERLAPQLQLAYQRGFAGRWLDQATRLLDHIQDFLGGREVRPSLLHGDLWSGNAAECAGSPVIFDPAIYFGDREADLAMTRLFGGFSERFHEAYAAVWPPAPGAELRVTLYNVYHMLDHLNLFGTGYLPDVEQMLEQLLAEIRG